MPSGLKSKPGPLDPKFYLFRFLDINSLLFGGTLVFLLNFAIQSSHVGNNRSLSIEGCTVVHHVCDNHHINWKPCYMTPHCYITSFSCYMHANMFFRHFHNVISVMLVMIVIYQKACCIIILFYYVIKRTKIFLQYKQRNNIVALFSILFYVTRCKKCNNNVNYIMKSNLTD